MPGEVKKQEVLVGSCLVSQKRCTHSVLGYGAAQTLDIVHRRLQQHLRLLVAALQTSQVADAFVQSVAQLRQRQAVG
jgi:hypothetical protein